MEPQDRQCWSIRQHFAATDNVEEEMQSKRQKISWTLGLRRLLTRLTKVLVSNARMTMDGPWSLTFLHQHNTRRVTLSQE